MAKSPHTPEPADRQPGENSEWSACEANELVSLGQRLRTNEQRSNQRKTAATAAIACFVGVVAFGSLFWLDGDNLGGISCGECHAQFDEYHDYLTNGGPIATDRTGLDANAARSMELHLANCNVCRPKFEARFPGLLNASLQQWGGLLVRSDVQTGLGILNLATMSRVR